MAGGVAASSLDRKRDMRLQAEPLEEIPESLSFQSMRCQNLSLKVWMGFWRWRLEIF